MSESQDPGPRAAPSSSKLSQSAASAAANSFHASAVSALPLAPRRTSAGTCSPGPLSPQPAVPGHRSLSCSLHMLLQASSGPTCPTKGCQRAAGTPVHHASARLASAVGYAQTGAGQAQTVQQRGGRPLACSGQVLWAWSRSGRHLDVRGLGVRQQRAVDGGGAAQQALQLRGRALVLGLELRGARPRIMPSPISWLPTTTTLETHACQPRGRAATRHTACVCRPQARPWPASGERLLCMRSAVGGGGARYLLGARLARRCPPASSLFPIATLGYRPRPSHQTPVKPRTEPGRAGAPCRGRARGRAARRPRPPARPRS